MNMSEPRRFRLTPGGQTLADPYERQSQAAVFQWLDLAARTRWPELAFVFAVPNGEKRDKATAVMLQRQGVKPGVLDIWVPFARGGYVGMVIEMKRKPKVPSEAQETWLAFLAANHWKTAVAYGADAAIAELIGYVTARPTVIA